MMAGVDDGEDVDMWGWEGESEWAASAFWNSKGPTMAAPLPIINQHHPQKNCTPPLHRKYPPSIHVWQDGIHRPDRIRQAGILPTHTMERIQGTQGTQDPSEDPSPSPQPSSQHHPRSTPNSTIIRPSQLSSKDTKDEDQGDDKSLSGLGKLIP